MHYSNWQNKIAAIWLIILLLFAAGLSWAWINQKIHIQNDVFALLPEQKQDPSLAATQQYISQQLNNKVILVINAANDQQLKRAQQLILARAKTSDLWQPIKTQADPEQFSQTLYQHQAGLISAEDVDLLKNKQYAALQEKSLLQIMSPGFPVTADLLAKDPLLLFPRFAMQLAEQSPSQQIDIENGFATLRDQQNISRLYSFEITNSAYNVAYQQQTAAWIQQLKQDLSKIGVKSHWTGSLLFASFGTDSAKKEISTIGLGSGLGILFLIWFGFRSLRPMLTELLAVASGVLVAFVVTHYIYAEIHLMTLIFGASLIGISVDCSFYYMALQSQQKKIAGFKVLKPILPSLFVGLVTTIIAYLFLIVTPFPGFRQIAVFSIVGLSTAWISNMLLLPRLKPLNAEPAIKTLHFIGTARNYFLDRPKLRLISIGLIVAAASISLPFLKSNDDIRNLQSMDQQLKQQDQYIAANFGQNYGNDYFVIQADHPQQLEEIEQQLISGLHQLKDQSLISNFQAIGSSVPSQKQQIEHIGLLQQIPVTALQSYAGMMQLNPADVLAWQKRLSSDNLLSLDQFSSHPLLFLQPNDKQRLVLIQGIKDQQAVQSLESAAVKLVQPIDRLSKLFQSYRIQAQWFLVYALLALSISLSLIYGIRALPALILPVVLALLATFTLQAWIGIELNLFSIMGTFLIIGIGVDYAIFYRQGHAHPHVVGMALFLCMMSTILGFGLLSFSHTYAIHCFGLTVLFGVIFSFLFSTLLTTTVKPIEQKN